MFSNIRMYLLLILLALSFPLQAVENAKSDGSLITVKIQLKWFHQFQFAGFYAAIKQGYFEQQGLDVILLEGGPHIDSADVVTSGEAKFGVGNTSLLIKYNQGVPVVALSAIFQRSPSIILARRNKNIRTVLDLENRKLMLEPNAAEIIAYLTLAGVDMNKIELVEHSGGISLLSKNHARDISALTAYSSIEPYLASKLNIPYNIFSPRDLDINFYGDILFTSQAYARDNPEVLIAMRKALNEGWKYASSHHDELISHILEEYNSAARLDRLLLSYEAQSIEHLLEEDIIEVGYMSHSRWKSIAQTYVKAGLLEANYTLHGFMFEVEEKIPAWASKTLVAEFVVIVLGFLSAAYILRLNRKLSDSLIKVAEQSRTLEQANKKLSDLSNTDALTSLANRRRFDEVINNELLRAKRTHRSISMLLIDVDHFKSYNDYYGHPAGDKCLAQLAGILQHSACRASDLVARYGGEEFAIILAGMDIKESLYFAKTICEKVQEAAITHHDSAFSVLTVSIGVTSCMPDNDISVDDIISRADVNLYRAKSAGRNQAC